MIMLDTRLWSGGRAGMRAVNSCDVSIIERAHCFGATVCWRPLFATWPPAVHCYASGPQGTRSAQAKRRMPPPREHIPLGLSARTTTTTTGTLIMILASSGT